jgi:hypothetical protein
VRAMVTATNSDGSSQAATPASAIILAAPPVNSVAPTLAGVTQVGKTLTSSNGTWSGVPTLAYAYQWQVSVDGGLTWSDIPGATASSLVLLGRFTGKRLRVVVTATNPDGSDQAASPASAVIFPGPAAPNTNPPTTPIAIAPTPPASPEPTPSGPSQDLPANTIGTRLHTPPKPQVRHAKAKAASVKAKAKPKRRPARPR